MAGSGKGLKDKDIIDLLSRLKTAGAKYPADLLSKRQAKFMTGVDAMGKGGGSVSRGGSSAGPGWRALTGMTWMDKFAVALGLIAIAGLITYFTAAAYTNREYLKNLFFPSKPTAVQVIPPKSTNVIPTSPKFSLTRTMTEMPTASLTPEVTPYATDESQQNGQTPAPKPIMTNPGLHLGQTKVPNPASNPANPGHPKPPNPHDPPGKP